MSKSITPIDSSDFKLSPELAELAKRHYGETDEIRRQSIDLLRDWAEKNPRIEKIRLDSSFLLRFLRSRHFSVPMAQELIERYVIHLNTEMNGKFFYENFDVFDEKIQELLNRGFSFILPKTDMNGNLVYVLRVSVLDPSIHEPFDVYRVHLMCLALNEYQENNIHQYKLYFDMKGFTTNHVKFALQLMEVMPMCKVIEKLFGRICHSFYILNLSPSFAWIVDKILSIFNEKTRVRTFLHEDASCLMESNDEENLPIEYGGKLEMEDVIENYKKLLEAKREDILLLKEMKVNLELYPKCVRESKISSFKKTIEEIIDDEKNSKHVDFEEVRGSFKKLEID